MLAVGAGVGGSGGGGNGGKTALDDFWRFKHWRWRWWIRQYKRNAAEQAAQES
jgi:hypothetical protein